MSSPHHPQGPRETQVLTEDAWQDERRFKVTTGDEWFEIFVQTMGIFFLGFSEQMCFLPPFFAQILVILVTNSNNKNIYHLKSSNIHPFHHSVRPFFWISGALKELQGPISQYGVATDSAKPLRP